MTCEREAETMAHFVSTDNPDIQYEIASKIDKRMNTIESKLQEAGLNSDPGSQALELIGSASYWFTWK